MGQKGDEIGANRPDLQPVHGKPDRLLVTEFTSAVAIRCVISRDVIFKIFKNTDGESL